jgi:deoxyribodipyrimidine photolyase-related protein
VKSITLIFPHQLYASHPPVATGREIYLIEYELFFSQYKFHKQKLMLHRASMKYYEQQLKAKGHRVKYIEHHEPLADMEALFMQLAAVQFTQVHLAEPADYLLERRLRRYAAKYHISLHYSTNPNFVRSRDDNERYFAEHKFFLTDY